MMTDRLKLSVTCSQIKIYFAVTVAIFCGCYIIGICLLWADFRSQHY